MSRVLVTGGAGFVGSPVVYALVSHGHDVAVARARVVHLAAQIDVRHSADDPAGDVTVNVVGTATVLEAARRAGAERLGWSALTPLTQGLARTLGAVIVPEEEASR